MAFRYSQEADWAYVAQCVRGTPGLSLVGNGDVMSFTDYNARMAACPGLATIMLARGALVKPWLFTEVQSPEVYWLFFFFLGCLLDAVFVQALASGLKWSVRQPKAFTQGIYRHLFCLEDPSAHGASVKRKNEFGLCIAHSNNDVHTLLSPLNHGLQHHCVQQRPSWNLSMPGLVS